MRKQVIIGFAIILCGIFIVLSNTDMFNISYSKNNDEQALQTYDGSDLEQLTVKSTSINLKLMPSNDDQVRLKLYDSANKPLDIASYVTGTYENNELTLKVNNKKQGFSFFFVRNRTLELEIPKERIHELSIESSSGNIDIQDIIASEISLQATSGNIDAEDLSARSISSETSSGNITINQIEAEIVELEATSGNIDLADLKVHELKLETTSGNITADGDTSSIEANASSGNIDLDFIQLTANSDLKTTSGDIKLSLDNVDSLHVIHDKTSGNSKITKAGFETREMSDDRTDVLFGNGDVKLEVETTSGSFSLK